MLGMRLYAQDSGDTTIPPNPINSHRTYITIQPVPKNPGGRPKIPSMQHIECWYEDGMLTLDFAIPEGDCVLTVTEEQTGMSSGYSFDSASTAQVYIGEIWNATIEINTENGHSYKGWLGD